MSEQLDAFPIRQAIKKSEIVHEWLRVLREQAQACGRQEVAEAATEAILDIGSALDKVERAVKKANNQPGPDAPPGRQLVQE